MIGGIAANVAVPIVAAFFIAFIADVYFRTSTRIKRLLARRRLER